MGDLATIVVIPPIAALIVAIAWLIVAIAWLIVAIAWLIVAIARGISARRGMPLTPIMSFRCSTCTILVVVVGVLIGMPIATRIVPRLRRRNSDACKKHNRRNGERKLSCETLAGF